MKSIKNTSITFGLVNIPIKVYAATEDKAIHFNQIHSMCSSKIRELKHCPNCERTVTADEIIKGYSIGTNSYIPFLDEDFASLPTPNKDSIEILGFVKPASIDAAMYEKAYFVEPTKVGRKGFLLLLKAMKSKKVAAVATITFRSKQQPCVFQVRGNDIVMSTMLFRDEVREFSNDLSDITLSKEEVSMAESLVDSMTDEDFGVEQVKDTYRVAVQALIELKLVGGEIAGVVEAATIVAPKVDLMDALAASLNSLKEKKLVKKK
jgi:DNA end-binding protein Ku